LADASKEGLKWEGADGIREIPLGAYRITGTEERSSARTETAGYGTVRPVVWEDGGGDPASYPLAKLHLKMTVDNRIPIPHSSRIENSV